MLRDQHCPALEQTTSFYTDFVKLRSEIEARTSSDKYWPLAAIEIRLNVCGNLIRILLIDEETYGCHSRRPSWITRREPFRPQCNTHCRIRQPGFPIIDGRKAHLTSEPIDFLQQAWRKSSTRIFQVASWLGAKKVIMNGMRSFSAEIRIPVSNKSLVMRNVCSEPVSWRIISCSTGIFGKTCRRKNSGIPRGLFNNGSSSVNRAYSGALSIA